MGSTVGKYKVLARVGKGGMGEVYRAVQTELQREVALKVLSEDVSASKATERFMREARLQAELEHPNLVRVYDVGQAGDRLFFAMELVNGETLSKRMSKVGRPHPSFVAKVARQMAAAFLYYFPKGLVHRDIKPSNLMLCADEEETLKLMDFGIALKAGSERLTRTRAVVGTARYLSPEMARGEDLTGKSDVYQLGVVLYEMVCGSPPHSGPPAVAIARRASGERAPDPRKAWAACPDRLAHLVNACLEPNPEERIDAQALHDEAEALEFKLRSWEPPAVPPPPWTGEEEVGPASSLQEAALSGRRAPISSSGPASGIGSGPASAQQGAPVEGTPRLRAALAVAFVLGLLGLGRLLATPGVYRAEEMLIRSGARGVVLSWASRQPYESRIRYGPEGTPDTSWSTAVGSDDGLAHRLVLEGLQPSVKYRFHVLFPDGKRSLDYGFMAPQPFAVQRLRASLEDPDTLRWTFRTPAPVRARVEVETAGGETLVREENEATETHGLRFPVEALSRSPREVRARFAAADGEVEVPWPSERALGLYDLVTETFGPRRVDWTAILNRIDEIRLRPGPDGEPAGFAPDLWRRELREEVETRFGETGLLDHWRSVSRRVSGFVHGDAPWAERRPVLRALAYLSTLDRVHDLYDIPPPFQVLRDLAETMHPYATRPFPPGQGVEVDHVFPYDANMLVPSNYTAKSRDQINSMSTTVFPRKGEVRVDLEGTLEVPGDTPFEEVVVGLNMRGIYPFFAVLVHLNEGSGDARKLPFTVPFYQEAEMADAPLKDEFSALSYLAGRSIDDVFPVHEVWMRIPVEAVGPGTNRFRIEILSLQSHTILPSVVRRVILLGRPRGA